MTTKFGVFSEKVATVGEPYVDLWKTEQHQTARGQPNIKAAVGKTGKTNDATFDKFKPLFEGEKYIDPLRLKLMAQNAGKKHVVSSNSFKPASPMKHSVGLGDYYGTIGGKIPYEPGCQDVKKTKGEIVSQPRSMVVGASTKKGGFGFNKTTISERQGYKGVAGEYEYIADPIHQATRKADQAAVTPFRPVGVPMSGGPGTVTRNMLGRVKGAVGEFEWRPCPDVKPGASADGGEAGGAAPASMTPFRPVGLPKKGPLATFNKYPEYLHDPEAAKIAAAAAARKAAREKLPGGGTAWRPGSGSRTDATRSIVRMNLK